MTTYSLKGPLTALAIFNLVDYWLSKRCLAQGFHEANPLLLPLVDTPWFFVIKVVLVPLGLYWIWQVNEKIRTLSRSLIWFTTSIYTLLMGYYAVLFLSGLAT